MKALTPTLSREARRETGVSRRPMRERGRTPSPAGGRRWPEGPDEGAVIEPRIDALDWPALESELDAFGCAVAPELISPETCRELAALYADDGRFRSRIVMASPWLRPGRVQIFRRPAAGPDRRAPSRPLSAPRAGRRPLERGDGRRRALPRRARGVSGPLPRGGPDATDAASAALCAGRLQLPASGRLRRASVSAPGRDPALRARTRLRRRRVRTDRAAAAHAVAGGGRELEPGRRGHLRGARAARRRARAAPIASTCAMA